MRSLDLGSAEPGVYAVRSAVPDSFLILVERGTAHRIHHLVPRRRARAVLGGRQADRGARLGIEDGWYPLLDVGAKDDWATDAGEGGSRVVVGESVTYRWAAGRLTDPDRSTQISVAEIEGPLAPDAVEALLRRFHVPPFRPVR